LQSANEVMDGLINLEDSPSSTQQIIAAAGRQFHELHSASPAAVLDFVRRVVGRVVIHPNRIEVEVRKRELLAVLAGEPRAALRQGPGESILLALKAQIKRCGGEMRLIVPPDVAGQVGEHPVPSLLKALARGRQWYEWIVAGEVSGRRSIAQKVGFDERHVAQILECAFLAPDIVGAILDGRQPSGLTWRKLTRHLPLNWVEQRKRLGFAALAPTEKDSL
jgi:site-specific DNA recombinase